MYNNTSAFDIIRSNLSQCADARLESAGGGAGGPGEGLARRALLTTGHALSIAVLTAPLAPRTPPAAPPPAPPLRHHPPLTHTLYDVFRHLALEFHNKVNENVSTSTQLKFY